MIPRKDVLLMFDMELTGKRLAKFRRDANMTQMEVAEKLGISFQAVSYWERGKTMPDISKLVQIARLYNVSIDAILDNDKQSRAVRNVSQHKKTPDLLEIISIMKPSEISEAIERSQLNVESFDQITDSAPYLEEDILSGLAAANSDLVRDFSQVCMIASFIDQTAFEKVALDNSDKVTSFRQICEVACRMSKPAISQLAAAHTDLPDSFSQICNIACFMEKEPLCALVSANAEKVESFSQICNIACFIDKETLCRLVETNCSKAESYDQVSALACFLTPESLTVLAFAAPRSSISDFELNNICYYLSEKDAERFRDLFDMG